MFNQVRPPMYDQASVQPMRDELISVGFRELKTPEEVESTIKRNDDKVVLAVVNSVCGCAAGSARPGVSLALQNSVIPDDIVTVFAGQERDAVDALRSYIKEAPSSPSMALFKNGEPIYYMPRYEIEGRSADQIAELLVKVFNHFCSAKGPSVAPEVFAKLDHVQACGSKIPLFNIQ